MHQNPFAGIVWDEPKVYDYFQGPPNNWDRDKTFYNVQRDTAAARRFFDRALRYGRAPVQVTTDKAGPYLRVLDELVHAAAHEVA